MPLKVNSPLPSFEGISRWVGQSLRDEELAGHPVLIDFWALSCPFCLMNMPRLHQWRETYAASGLQIVTIHRPRMGSDKNEAAIRAALEQYEITDPCALDFDGILAERFETANVSPYYFLFDSKGTMRSRAAGGSGLQLLENALQRSLSLPVVTV